MAGIFYEPLSRHDFLRISCRLAGSLPFLLAARSWAQESTDSLHLALLSDTHIPADPADAYRGFRPVDNLTAILPQVIDSRPEGVILNGDAARLTGEVADYQRLQAMLRPLAEKTPVYIGLGNHDDRQNFSRIFGQLQPDSAVRGKQTLVIDGGPVRLIVLDSLLYVNQVAGLLGQQQRAWLEQYLRDSEARPTVLIVHHTLGEGDGDLLDTDRLFRLLEPFPQVKAVFYGHSHRYTFEQRGSVQLINLPAVGYNFSDDQPVGWVDARFTASGVTLTLHAIGGNRDEDGQTRTIEWA